MYWDSLLKNSAALHSIKLTLIVAPIAVLFNTLFGIAGGVADFAVSVSRPNGTDHADRFAVFRFAGCGRFNADAYFRPPGIFGPLAAADGYSRCVRVCRASCWPRCL